MIVPFELGEVRQVDSFEQAAEPFGELTGGTLPLFVVNEATKFRGEYPFLTDPLQALADAHGLGSWDRTTFYRDYSNPSGPRVTVDARDPSDVGLHIDGEWTLPVDVSIFATARGRGWATFFETASAEAPAEYDMLEGTRLFFEDRVDDTLLRPVAYRVEFGPKKTLFFRRGGRFALAHIFETTEYPRESSRVRVARNN